MIVWVCQTAASVTYLFRTPVLFSHVFAALQKSQDLFHRCLLLLKLLHLQALPTSPRLLLEVV